jgi:hypothetical protein
LLFIISSIFNFPLELLSNVEKAVTGSLYTSDNRYLITSFILCRKCFLHNLFLYISILHELRYYLKEQLVLI